MFTIQIHEKQKEIKLSESAWAYDPPVERSSWKLEGPLTKVELTQNVCGTLALDEAGVRRIFWHGGFYLNKKRTAYKAVPSQLPAGTEIEIYRFLREPEPFLLDKNVILFDGEGILAVNKPAWLPVQATRVSEQFNLEQALRKMTDNPNLIAAHRLDRQTSGVVLFAKNSQSAGWIMKQFMARKVHKKYLAIVSPVPAKTEGEIKGCLARDFKRLPQIYYRLIFDERPKARFSHTNYRVVESKNDLALVEAEPVTGRTHQIRVHLASIGSPVIGDYLYGKKSPSADRIQLHSSSLEFEMKEGKGTRKISIEAPLPEDFVWRNL